jgi:Lrp/AsnC family transcriptional regulator, leucine-responsive regulatory protein
MAKKEQDLSYTLDDKDYQILTLLQRNAKLTVREIAHEINLSPTPVHERIKRLEANRIIKQYVTLIDHAALEERIVVICYVSLKEHTKKGGGIFIDAIHELDEVIECYNISGKFDFMLKVIVKNMAAYHRFHVHKLSEIEGISTIQTVFVMDVIKENLKPLVLPLTEKG